MLIKSPDDFRAFLHYLVTILVMTISLIIFVSMAYNNKNKFLRVQEVQQTYLLHKTDGNTTRWVYREHIYPRWKISMATLYNYLAINVRKELKQLDLFN